MTAKKKPPSMLAMVERIYRKQLATDKVLNSLLREVQILRLQVDTTLNTALADAAHIETIKTLTNHCERLLREKEAILAGRAKLDQANEFIAKPVPIYADLWEQARARVAAAVPTVDRIVDGSVRRRPAYELCGFVATHAAGVRCGVCEWDG